MKDMRPQPLCNYRHACATYAHLCSSRPAVVQHPQSYGTQRNEHGNGNELWGHKGHLHL